MCIGGTTINNYFNLLIIFSVQKGVKKNTHYNVANLKVTFSNVVFCPSKNPKPDDIQSFSIKEQKILKLEELETFFMPLSENRQ